MGRGNLIPEGNLEDYRFFYVSYELIHGENYYIRRDDYNMKIEYEVWYDTLWKQIKNKWNSFYKVEEFRNNDTLILCENKLNRIELVDGDSYIMISVVVPNDIMDSVKNLAYRHMIDYYKGLLEIFKNWYYKDFLEGKLTYRTSPWTSAKIDLNKV